MRFDIITIFPEIINAYLSESIIKRACERGLLDVHVHNLRNFTDDKHRTVDDKPYGGGPGMVLKIEPIVRAVNHVKHLVSDNLSDTKCLTLITSADGIPFDAKQAGQFSKKYGRIILIAGHYEGIDARLEKILRVTSYELRVTPLSIGPFVLTGGELPALVVLDAVSRHIPGVLGKEESLEERRYGVGVPVYTRPEVFEYNGKKYKIPGVLKSGDHKRIEEWRRKHKTEF